MPEPADKAAADVARRAAPSVTVAESGTGASREIRTRLDALPDPSTDVAIDISGDYLAGAIRRLAPDFPNIALVPACADYAKAVRLPRLRPGRRGLWRSTSTS